MPQSKGSTKRRKQPVDNATAARHAAAAGTRAAGKAAALAMRRARVPLVIGGAAVAGAVGGLAVRSRQRQRPKLDLHAVESTAKRVSELTGQIGTVAAAMQRQADRS